MISEPLTAYLLHQRDAGETSAQLILFTKEKGLIHARFSGARTQKKRGILQPFMPLWVIIDERSYGAYVKSIEIASYPRLLSHQAMISGLYVNELLYRTMHQHEVEALLFEQYQETLDNLMQANDRFCIERALRCFEWRLIESLGTMVSFVFEADGITPLIETASYQLVPDAGFVLNETGYLGANLFAMAQQKWDDSEVLRTAKHLMRRMIDHQLDGASLEVRALYATLREVD